VVTANTESGQRESKEGMVCSNEVTQDLLDNTEREIE
jgi:hypothetical protein